MEYWLYRHYSRALQWPHLEFVACFRFHHPLWFMLVLKINLASYAVVSSHKLQSVIAAFCNLLLQQTCIIESHSYHQGYHTLCCPEDLEREARIAKPPQLAHFIVYPILPYLTFLVICIYNRVHSATSQSHRWGLEHQSTGKLRILPLVKVILMIRYNIHLMPQQSIHYKLLLSLASQNPTYLNFAWVSNNNKTGRNNLLFPKSLGCARQQFDFKVNIKLGILFFLSWLIRTFHL